MATRILLLATAFAIAPVLGMLRAAPGLPSSWEKSAHLVANDHPILLGIALQQRGLDDLRQAAHRVSDPGSVTYGQYLTSIELDAMTAPAPQAVGVVETWLHSAGVPFVRRNEHIHAVLTVGAASVLLNTSFSHAVCNVTLQRAVIADDYLLPASVSEAVQAVYGLHGLPLPSRAHQQQDSAAAQRVNVTPATVRSQYGLDKHPAASASIKNRQAVAEYLDQTMGPSDLETFFEKFASSVATTDRKVHKFVGDNGTAKMPGLFGPTWGIESSLDVDYIMGVAPGVLTEFWYYSGTDFCLGMKRWVNALLNEESPPLVNSVSYGFQGNISNIGCAKGEVEDIDIAFTKLAARGITVIVASGDSGSGYVEPKKCDPDKVSTDVSVTGPLMVSLPAMEDWECCDLASNQAGAKAWSFHAPQPADECLQLENATILVGTVYREEEGTDNDFCCEQATNLEVVAYSFINGTKPICRYFRNVTGKAAQSNATSGRVRFGVCNVYSEVSGKVASKGVVSGGDALFPNPVRVWPSWPASSPWVTAVGGTTFENQTLSLAEVATKTFGSGGGFSDMFPAFKDQSSAVEHYLSTATSLPPSGSFSTGGRGTPDLSALAEGYWIVANGGVNQADGTSASAPAFAAIVSVINEERIKAGKPAMGYLNPWLYANPDMFTDITKGSNALGRGTGPLKYGFKCAAGWDPVTGLGSPRFDKMLASALAVGTTSEIVV